MSEYLGLIMTLIFAFGLVFQLPVVTTLMARVGLISSQGLADKRKYAIVAAFVAAAILTPARSGLPRSGLRCQPSFFTRLASIAARLVGVSALRERLWRKKLTRQIRPVTAEPHRSDA